MNNDKTKPRRGISLKLQIVISLLGLIIMTIVVCLIMNSFFLEKYYLKNKESAIKSAYSMINNAFNDGNVDSDEMGIEIRRVCATYNISMIVLDESTNAILASQDDTDILMMQLLENLFGINGNNKSNDNKTVVEEKDKYTLQLSDDIQSGDRYIEMWGILDCGNVFLIRCAVDSISDSISISNRFLIYTGLIVAVIGIAISLVVSKKISGPIMELAQISNRMKALDFGIKYNVKTNNEIGILGENINELSETLEETISELKTANMELERDLEKKTKDDDMRKEFLANVSHELKTPLALIQGYAEGLKDCVIDDPESREYYCDVIVDESNKMNTMVRKLLTLNQLEFGTDNITVERFDIVALVRGCLQSQNILIEQNNAQVNIDDYPPIDVWADQIMCEEVFTNYFTNALHHLNEEKCIDIKIMHTDDSTVRVSVFNTGDPIPDDALEHIWEKFYKVDKARTREYGGSGVGLSIVKAIQESMNKGYGVVNYSNGVEFYFDLDASKRG